MCFEIEAKLKVDSLERVERRLDELGAGFEGEQIHIDSYYDRCDNEMLKQGKGLRLRLLSTCGSQKAILSYKGPCQESIHKKRVEIETNVGDGVLMEKLLLAIGFEKLLTFEKKRRLWDIDGCKVALDELPLLGCFVEIEGPNEKTITNVQGKLQLSQLPHISDSYAQLMAGKLADSGINEKEILM